MNNRYQDDLSWKIQPGDVSVQSKGRYAEWSEEGLTYLYQVKGGCVDGE